MKPEQSPFQYCTRCGSELPDSLKVAYTENDTPKDTPPLCMACFSEICENISEALRTPIDRQVRAINDAFEPLLDMVGSFSPASGRNRSGRD